MRKIYFLLLTFFASLLVGCIMSPSIVSTSNDSLTAEEQRLKCQEICTDFPKVSILTRQNYTDLQQARDDNSFLYRKVEDLNRSIGEQKTVLELQETVIRLFDDSNRSMQKNIAELIAAQKNTNQLEKERGKWVFTNASLFEVGTTELSSSGRKNLQQVADTLRNEGDVFIRVAGHADDRSLKKTADYANNWELSTQRAAAVVQFLHRVGGLPPERLSATGYGYYQPLVSNESAAGRQRNSRIEIVAEGRHFRSK